MLQKPWGFAGSLLVKRCHLDEMSAHFLEKIFHSAHRVEPFSSNRSISESDFDQTLPHCTKFL